MANRGMQNGKRVILGIYVFEWWNIQRVIERIIGAKKGILYLSWKENYLPKQKMEKK